MNVHSLLPTINAPSTVLITSGLIVTLAAIGAFLPLRNGNGQHAGAGPGTFGIRQVRDYASPDSPRLPETPEPPQFSAPTRPPESHRSDTPEPADPEPADPSNEIPGQPSETRDPHTELYGYPDLYSCRALFDATPAREAFDTITVQRLEPPHNPNKPRNPHSPQPPPGTPRPATRQPPARPESCEPNKRTSNASSKKASQPQPIPTPTRENTAFVS